MQPDTTMASILLASLRRAGWTVAVHNDFRLGGKPHTFWLLTHEATKRYAQGEGQSDQEALEICAHEAAMVTEAPLMLHEPDFEEPDPYVSFAAGAYGVSAGEVTPEQRKAAKLATYMLAYGADTARAAATMGVTVEALITSAEAVYPTLVPKERRPLPDEEA
jgi:hypothetical protein